MSFPVRGKLVSSKTNKEDILLNTSDTSEGADDDSTIDISIDDPAEPCFVGDRPASAPDGDNEDGYPRTKVYGLGLSSQYVTKWTCRDAFRELYQNWKDAIIESFKIDPRRFTPTTIDDKKQIQIEIHAPATEGSSDVEQPLLGFIRFMKKSGTLELTNFQAKLDEQHLLLGGTSKRDQERFAGTHGEGFKLAALVLHRHGHRTHFAASSCRWNFTYKGSSLCCRVTRVSSASIGEQREQYARDLATPPFRRRPVANVWEDVSVKIHKLQGGAAISESEFRSWLPVALELNPPPRTHIISTEHGDLIWDSRFVGRIFLKGLEITGYGNAYAFAYNYARGMVNRDRERLANLPEEQQALVSVLGLAILSGSPAIVAAYVKLMQTDTDCVEVSWTRKYMLEGPVRVIWRWLKTTYPDAFFYLRDSDTLTAMADQSMVHMQTSDFSVDRNTQIAMIENELKKTPHPLSRDLWKLLRRYSMILTPGEEQVRRFSSSRSISPNDIGQFAVTVASLLNASISLGPALSTYAVQFVESDGTDLDLLFCGDRQTLLINRKWLDFDYVHLDSTCSAHDLGHKYRNRDIFLCDHVVEDLFEIVLQKIRTVQKLSMGTYRIWRSLARECLRLMPRLVRTATTDQQGTLEVTWIGNECGLVSEHYGDDILYRVTLHKKSSCRSVMDTIISYRHHEESLDTWYGTPQTRQSVLASSGQCQCPVQIVSRTQSKAIFSDLDPQEHYFPMVARARGPSFFGNPPTPLAPRDCDIGPPTPSSSATMSVNTAEIVPAHVDTRPSAKQELDKTVRIRVKCDGQVVPDERATLANQDQVTWYQWFRDDLPLVFARYRSSHQPTSQPKSLVYDDSSHDGGQLMQPAAQNIVSLYCPQLNHRFVKGQYACIELQGFMKQPMFVHGIYTQEEFPTMSTAYLCVTKFSYLESTPLARFGAVADPQPTPTTQREVVLHFKDFEKMGMVDDGEMVRLDSVVHVEMLQFKSGTDRGRVNYGAVLPRENREHGISCRFAMQSTEHESEACLTPVAPHLLGGQLQTRPAAFQDIAAPAVYDLTPGVLGPAEGFTQANLCIAAGLDFDSERHLTWRARHSRAQIYDGDSVEALEALQAGTLHPLPHHPAAAKVAVAAAVPIPFRLNDQNDGLPQLSKFLGILYQLDFLAASAFRPDFVVMLTSPALLHPQTGTRWTTTLTALLEQRYSVHLQLYSARELGAPLERDVLAVVATSSPGLFKGGRESGGTVIRPSIQDLIDDLAFENSRENRSATAAFVCPCPDRPASQAHTSPRDTNHTYNHQTGAEGASGLSTLPWDAPAIHALTEYPLLYGHPVRQDLITVRELARLQGFPDDFIFYLSTVCQYNDVWTAIPPVVTRLIGEDIRRAIRQARAITIHEPSGGPKTLKRQRTECDIETG